MCKKLGILIEYFVSFYILCVLTLITPLKEIIKRLQILQDRTMRIILGGSKYAHVEDIKFQGKV